MLDRYGRRGSVAHLCDDSHHSLDIVTCVWSQSKQWDMRLVTAPAVGHAVGLFLVRDHALGHKRERERESLSLIHI